jgi:hypothetical protein
LQVIDFETVRVLDSKMVILMDPGQEFSTDVTLSNSNRRSWGKIEARRWALPLMSHSIKTPNNFRYISSLHNFLLRVCFRGTMQLFSPMERLEQAKLIQWQGLQINLELSLGLWMICFFKFRNWGKRVKSKVVMTLDDYFS